MQSTQPSHSPSTPRDLAESRSIYIYRKQHSRQIPVTVIRGVPASILASLSTSVAISKSNNYRTVNRGTEGGIEIWGCDSCEEMARILVRVWQFRPEQVIVQEQSGAADAPCSVLPVV